MKSEAAPAANVFKPFRDKLPYWKQFAAISVEGGEAFRACCAFRKYLVRLVRDLGLSTEVRKQAVSVSTLQEIWDVLDLFASQEETAAVGTWSSNRDPFYGLPLAAFSSTSFIHSGM